VVLLWENGLIGYRSATSITLPIFKTEREHLHEDMEGWSKTLAGRSHLAYETAELDYLLHVSLPVFVGRTPVAAHAEMSLGSESRSAVRATSLNDRAAVALEEAMPEILLRATARALTKYLAKELAEEELGESAGFLVNLLGAGLERADTRSWRSLPGEIRIATLEVPPGIYEVRLEVKDAEGRRLEERTCPDVEAPAGGIAFIRHRSAP
jgi:hypothetical protein